MKKTCKGCYAAKTGKHPLEGEPHGCELGYKTDKKGHPLEECPKPKSWTKRFEEKPKGYKKTLVNPSSKQLVDAGLASKDSR